MGCETLHLRSLRQAQNEQKPVLASNRYRQFNLSVQCPHSYDSAKPKIQMYFSRNKDPRFRANCGALLIQVIQLELCVVLRTLEELLDDSGPSAEPVSECCIGRIDYRGVSIADLLGVDAFFRKGTIVARARRTFGELSSG